MILTEEELKEIESTYGRFNPTLLRMIGSHRNLLSANAELSYKNMRLSEENKTVNDDYKALVAIVDRARKLAFLSEDTQ